MSTSSDALAVLVDPLREESEIAIDFDLTDLNLWDASKPFKYWANLACSSEGISRAVGLTLANPTAETNSRSPQCLALTRLLLATGALVPT